MFQHFLFLGVAWEKRVDGVIVEYRADGLGD
jgi:hypothetical protein